MKKCPQCGTINPDHAVSCKWLVDLRGVEAIGKKMAVPVGKTVAVPLPEAEVERKPRDLSLPSLGAMSGIESPLDLPLLGFADIALVLIGLYILLVSPSASPVGDVVNLQKLAIGETLTISGFVLIAAQWRPR